MLFYPVKADHDTFVSIGFALLFPNNKIPKKISYSVRDTKSGQMKSLCRWIPTVPERTCVCTQLACESSGFTSSAI